MVLLDIAVEGLSKHNKSHVTYVLESSKPLWSGELENCAVLLGINALECLGFNKVQQDGTIVRPEE